jgi:alkylated DNA repair dioxygenase AlkB
VEDPLPGVDDREQPELAILLVARMVVENGGTVGVELARRKRVREFAFVGQDLEGAPDALHRQTCLAEGLYDRGLDESDEGDCAVVAAFSRSSEPKVARGFTELQRLQLDTGSWVDYLPNWVEGADQLFRELLDSMPWMTREVRMYDRLVVEPRLSSWWTTSSSTPFPIAFFSEIRRLLSDRYDRNLDSIGCNYYRDGRDSVAWHGDKLPGNPEEPVVAIVSTGSRRPFLLRPTGGGRSIRFEVGDGDLMVMGGQSQLNWQHSVPMVASSGPRISVTYRHQAPPPF